MQITMDDSRITTVAELQVFLTGAQRAALSLKNASLAAKYSFIQKVVKRFSYATLAKKDKRIVYLYLRKITGYRKAQLYRLLAKAEKGKLKPTPYHRVKPHSVYTSFDIKRLETTGCISCSSCIGNTYHFRIILYWKRLIPKTYENEDTKKQLLARSRYLLFKPSSKWTEKQKQRADILFREFPELEHAYNISMMFRSWYEKSSSKEQAKVELQRWYKKVEEENIEPFLVAAESIKAYEDTILNYFNNRSTNAAAESFNAKLKGFRTLVRGVRDIKFFLFRVAKLYE